MPVSVNKLTINTKVRKEGEPEGGGQASQEGATGGGAMSKIQREELIQECIDRVEELLDYRLNP